MAIGEKGYNTTVIFTFLRHSQKQSGLVFAPDSTAYSRSSISKRGRERAARFGAIYLKGRRITDAYATTFARTKETLEAALTAAGIHVPIIQPSKGVDAFYTLPESSESEKGAREYKKIFEDNKDKYTKLRYPERAFDDLTTDQQEEVAEIAEEPAIAWLLSFDNARPDPGTPSPREHAASVAFKMNRLISLADTLQSGKQVDIISCGHRTSTEAFLKYCLGFDDLTEIGGSLRILDSWTLSIQNNNLGKKNATLTLRRENGKEQKYGLDLDIVKKLATEHMASPLSV
jgi:broad specificity phosphatase PhoE